MTKKDNTMGNKTSKKANAKGRGNKAARGDDKPKRKASGSSGRRLQRSRGEVREAKEFKKKFDAAPDDGPNLNEGLLVDIQRAEELAHEAILVVTKDANLAASLADPAAHPKFMSMEQRGAHPAGEFLSLTYLCELAAGGADPNGGMAMDGEAGSVAWPKLCDAEGKVTTRRGRAQRKIPARDLEKWLRGDPSVLKPRQTSVLNSDEVAEVAERGGAKHYVRKRKSHTFEAEEYALTMTDGQLAKFRGEMSMGRRMRVIDQKMRLKKEVDEYPGDEHRSEEMGSLMGIILASSDKDAEDAP